MINIINRFKSAWARYTCSIVFTHNPAYSFFYLLSFKINRSKTAHGSYHSIPFTFRSTDIEALKEVLIDGEYDALFTFIKDKPGLKILDVGHHIGTFSLWCFAHNHTLEILGVEASPSTFAVAAKNCELGRSAGLNWHVLQHAAWKNNDPISFCCDGNPLGFHIHSKGQTTVQGITLPALLHKIGGHADLLKLDVEGAEEAFLCTFPDSLDHIESIVLEIHPKLCSEQNIRALLAKKFQVIQEIQAPGRDKPILWCRKS